MQNLSKDHEMRRGSKQWWRSAKGEFFALVKISTGSRRPFERAGAQFGSGFQRLEAALTGSGIFWNSGTELFCDGENASDEKIER